MPAGHRTHAPHLGLALIFVLVVEELIPTQHEPALLPVLHYAPLLLQPACLQDGAQPAGAGWLPRAPALLPHHQAFGAGWKPSTHTVSTKDGRPGVSPCPTLASQLPGDQSMGASASRARPCLAYLPLGFKGTWVGTPQHRSPRSSTWGSAQPA